MISKRIDRGGKTSSFETLGNYVLDSKNENSPILWTRTAEYIVDKEGEGEKILWYRITNCESDVPALAIVEVLATQSENTRTTSDKTYHLVVSFPEGECPTKEQMEDIEDRMCQELGYGEHQRISAVHKDTDNIHLHVAINKVHPKNHNVHQPLRDFYTQDRVRAEMEQKHGLIVDNHIGQGQGIGRTFDAQAHYGKPSFIRWVQANVGEQLLHVSKNGQRWQDVHAVLGEYGLEIRKRGAGFVIKASDSQRMAKASSIDRELSYKALTGKFGNFEESQVKVEPKQKYQENRHHDPGTKALFEGFQAYKTETKDKRQEFKADREQKFKQFQADLKDWATREREQVKSSNNPANWKREAYSNIAGERQRAWNEYKQSDAERKKAFYAENPILTWEQYLMKAAEKGNVSALACLRNKDFKKERFSQQFLMADNLEAAKHIIYQDMKPFAKRNGDLVYKVKDGGSVTDARQIVRVDEHSPGSAFLALSLASEKFQGQPLNIQGTDDFKAQIIDFAVKYSFDVTFKNPELETERLRLKQAREEKTSYDKLSPALQAYLGARNELREKVKTIPEHRVWTARDAGKLTYQGLRNLTDGSQIILWQKDDTMLVKPVQETHEFQGLKIGQEVNINENGQIQIPKGRSR